jgi:hypothetical protein
VYTAISLELSGWLHKAFEKIMKSFHWSGSDQVQGEVLGRLVMGAETVALWRPGGFGSEAPGDFIAGSMVMAATY